MKREPKVIKILWLIFGILILIAKFILDHGIMPELKEKFFKKNPGTLWSQTKYFYTYDSDKLINQTQETTLFVLGEELIPSTTQTDFVYNSKGLLIKEITQSPYGYMEKRPTITIFDYNEIDSLVSRIIISPDNDTTLWEFYKYYPDGRKTVFYRFLRLHFELNKKYLNPKMDKKFDTLLYRYEYDYVGGLCNTQRQYDKNGKLLKTIKFDFNDDALIKETHLTYFDDMEMTEKVKFYDYLKSKINPDFFSIDSKNDTIEISTHTFESEKSYKTANTFDYGKIIHEKYYENGLLIKNIDFDDQFKLNQTIQLYEYDKKGKLKTSKRIRRIIKEDKNQQ